MCKGGAADDVLRVVARLSGEVELLGRRTDARMERLEASIHAIATHLGAGGTVESLTPRLPTLPSIEDGKK